LNIPFVVVKLEGHTDGNDAVIKFVHPANVFVKFVNPDGQLVILIERNDVQALKVP
jgi:hypothetical protein